MGGRGGWVDFSGRLIPGWYGYIGIHSHVIYITLSRPPTLSKVDAQFFLALIGMSDATANRYYYMHFGTDKLARAICYNDIVPLYGQNPC